jgi:hypothetical protein
MATLADIKKHSQGIVSTSVDDSTPAGHFLATTLVLGKTACFLFEGEKDDLNAVVKGHVLITAHMDGKTSALAYNKGGVIGGIYMGRVQSYAETFAQMV